MREAEAVRTPLEMARLRALLPRSSRVDVVARCPSTNTALAGRVTDGTARDLEVLVAEHQVAGLGRLGRSFVTPDRAALTFSVALTPVGPPPTAWGWIPLMMGMAAVRAVNRLTGLHASMKWPNDVLVTGGPRPGKLAGVLATAGEDWVVVGMGLNVSQHAAELPVPTATSLTAAGADGIDRTALLAAVLTDLFDLTTRWRAAAGDAVTADLTDRAAACLDTLGRPVRVELPGGGQITGVARELAPGGELVVQTGAGGRQVIGAGDVHHLWTV